MLKILISILGKVCAFVALSYIWSRIEPNVPEKKTWRFFFLFAAWAPLMFAVNYVNVLLLGWPDMGWIGISLIALFFSAIGTIFPPFISTRYNEEERPNK
jgi:hypothetical protein